MPFTLGLTGYPLAHSLSPQIHTAALAACGLEGTYSLFPIPPERPEALAALLGRIRDGEIHGLNVTIPHKQAVLPLLDDLTETARAIGAVNTLFLRAGRLIGDNTDAPGFFSDLVRFLRQAGRDLPPAALVLGAGGSARAVVYALCRAGVRVTVLARRLEQAQQLAAAFAPCAVHAAAFSQLASLATSSSTPLLLVNTTPLGMSPQIETSPWPEDLPLPDQAVVYDLVYNPRQTRLMRQARAAGLLAETGLGMLIAQAALSFQTWTGCQPPDHFFQPPSSL